MVRLRSFWVYGFVLFAVIVSCAISSCMPRERPLEFISLPFLYGTNSVEVSHDGQFVLLGAASARTGDNTSLLMMLDAQTLYFNGVSGKISQQARDIEFVSDELGFLVGRSTEPGKAHQLDIAGDVGTLELFGLDGTRKVIVDSVPSPISSLSISADRKLVAVCSDASRDFLRWGECNVYSLEDGTLKSTFRPAEAFRLRAVMTKEPGEYLIVSETYNQSPPRATLIAGETGAVLHELDISDRRMQLRGLVGGGGTGEAFVALDGEVGRFEVRDGKFEFEERFYMGVKPDWIDYHAGTGRLAVGASYGGSKERAIVQIIDVKTQKAFETQINTAGPLKFAPDGKSLYILGRGVQKYFLDQLR